MTREEPLSDIVRPSGHADFSVASVASQLNISITSGEAFLPCLFESISKAEFNEIKAQIMHIIMHKP